MITDIASLKTAVAMCILVDKAINVSFTLPFFHIMLIEDIMSFSFKVKRRVTVHLAPSSTETEQKIIKINTDLAIMGFYQSIPVNELEKVFDFYNFYVDLFELDVKA